MRVEVQRVKENIILDMAKCHNMKMNLVKVLV